MADKIQILCIIVLCYVARVYSDYDCLCNYNVETSVYSSASQQAQPIGYLYEFDCKPVVNKAQELNDWITVAFEHQKGYVLKDDQTQVQVCAGNSPSGDGLTTSEVRTTLSLEPVTSAAQTTSTSLTTPTTETTDQTTTIPLTTTTATSTTKTTTTSRQRTTTTPLTSSPTTTKGTSRMTSTTVLSSVSAGTTTDADTFQSTATPTDGNIAECPSIIRSSALRDNGVLGQYGQNCYELLPDDKVSWEHGENMCKSRGGHLAHISSQEEQGFIQSFMNRHLPKHAVWIGFHDTIVEGQMEWTSGTNVTYTNWIPGHLSNFQSFRSEDCVAFIPYKNGQWDDIPCGDSLSFLGDIGETHPILCQYDVDNSQSTGSFTDGNIEMCPSSVKSTALRDNGVLGQYRQSCYELVQHDKVSWEHGENMCKSRGGHLAHISSQEEQGFIQSFMNRHLPTHAVWIGLHDTIVEGQMEWTSGTAVTYTKWIPGHLSNFQSFRSEDCVAFIPYKNGQWDDIPCGDSLSFFGDIGETHPILCQYEMMSSSQIVG